MTSLAIPRLEHPRPNFERAEWVNLNGIWDFKYDPEIVEEAGYWFSANYDDFTAQIVVPLKVSNDHLRLLYR